MVAERRIKTQSELDRVVKYIMKEIKWNSAIGEK